MSSEGRVSAAARAVLELLACGPARYAQAQGRLQLRALGGSSAKVVEPATLAELARRRWISREGDIITLGRDAPLLAQTAADARATERVTLVDGASTRLATRVRVESPLDNLRHRKDKAGRALISDAQWQAGDRLRTDFTMAQMMPGIGMRWTASPASGKGGGRCAATEQTDAAIAARQRVNRALGHVGPELAGLLADVCCFLKGLEMVEAERGWPARSARLMLATGLSILVRHYNPPARQSGATRHWGADDYRPEL